MRSRAWCWSPKIPAAESPRRTSWPYALYRLRAGTRRHDASSRILRSSGLDRLRLRNPDRLPDSPDPAAVHPVLVPFRLSDHQRRHDRVRRQRHVPRLLPPPSLAPYAGISPREHPASGTGPVAELPAGPRARLQPSHDPVAGIGNSPFRSALPSVEPSVLSRRVGNRPLPDDGAARIDFPALLRKSRRVGTRMSPDSAGLLCSRSPRDSARPLARVLRGRPLRVCDGPDKGGLRHRPDPAVPPVRFLVPDRTAGTEPLQGHCPGPATRGGAKRSRTFRPPGTPDRRRQPRLPLPPRSGAELPLPLAGTKGIVPGRQYRRRHTALLRGTEYGAFSRLADRVDRLPLHKSPPCPGRGRRRRNGNSQRSFSWSGRRHGHRDERPSAPPHEERIRALQRGDL
ncbi:MAG: hypothetical protein A4E73_03608 [Syntrophaceae bacterium PtaU1.Bin231]|nr:MAG: hypothetical protein A4E73_03608 [Syntrophaceae bacterium PtaU1.Bin231]